MTGRLPRHGNCGITLALCHRPVQPFRPLMASHPEQRSTQISNVRFVRPRIRLWDQPGLVPPTAVGGTRPIRQKQARLQKTQGPPAWMPGTKGSRTLTSPRPPTAIFHQQETLPPTPSHFPDALPTPTPAPPLTPAGGRIPVLDTRPARVASA